MTVKCDHACNCFGKVSVGFLIGSKSNDEYITLPINYLKQVRY